MFLWPMIVMQTYEKMPIQVGLAYLKSAVSTNMGELLAVAIIPTIIVFLVFQKYFIKTIVNTGLGGQ